MIVSIDRFLYLSFIALYFITKEGIRMEIGFIGFGLIGGSIARALRKNRKEELNICVYDIESPQTQMQLQQACEDHVIDEIVKDFDACFSKCKLIFLCAPVHNNAEYLKRLKVIIRFDCILTDVGSVKTLMHQKVEEIGLEDQFIGGHPMTGSEKSGYLNSSETLLENVYYILTPTKKTTQENINFLTNLVKVMGAIPLLLSNQEHDDIAATISHVPHIIAAQLVNLVKHSDDEDEKMKMLAAGGFKDITRIASSSPFMWQSICLSNAHSIKESLTKFIASLHNVMDAIDQNDTDYLYQTFEDAGIYRSQIPNNKGLIHRFFEVYLDITDEPGAIAIIATLLGSNGINIKNIGIIHNREFEEGVLRIELYSEEALTKACRLLKSHNYTIYERK